MIHPSAIVDPQARVASGVTIGPWSIIGADVEIAAETWIGPHVVVNGPTRIGHGNKIYQFCSIGDVPQDKKFEGERSFLEIGDRNVIREYTTFNRGTAHGGGVTRIGSDNWIMAYCHVAHDCQVGNDVVMANGATFAGHVTVEDHVAFGAFTTVHQFCTICTHSFSAMGTIIQKDVPPYVMVAGDPARPRGLNTTGLKRRGFDADTLTWLRRAFKAVYKQGLPLERAIVELEEMASVCSEVGRFVDCLKQSKRGIVR